MLLIPFVNDQPVIINMPGVTMQFVPFYSTVEKLYESMRYMGYDDYNIKQVDNIKECVSSIVDYGLRVMLDPYIHNGNTRWTELTKEGKFLDDEQLSNLVQRQKSESEGQSS